MEKQEMLRRAHELRDDPAVHYNCAQAVFVPFAERVGIGFEQAVGITANFGSGMRVGLTCGAITGGLMVLGLYGADQGADSAEFFRRMKEGHGGRTDCRDLLAVEVRTRAERRPHCDGMIFEAIDIVCDMLEARGLDA